MQDLTVCYAAFGSNYLKWAFDSIESVRQLGRFGGPFMIMTNQLGVKAPSYVKVKYSPDEPYIHESAGTVWKALLLRHCETHECLYLDADILVSGPLNEFFDHIDRSKVMGCFHNYGTRCYHTGVMWQRKEAFPILDKWLEMMMSQPFANEENALDLFWPVSQCSVFDEKYLEFPGIGDEKMLNRHGLFVHFMADRRRVVDRYNMIMDDLKRPRRDSNSQPSDRQSDALTS